MYAGASLSRIGCDFRPLITAVFEDAIVQMFAAQLDEAVGRWVENVLACREIMQRPNLSGAQAGFFYRLRHTKGMPVCRRPKAGPVAPVRLKCPGPNRSAVPQDASATGVVLRKVFCPCLAAFVFGETLSYVVDVSVFVLRNGVGDAHSDSVSIPGLAQGGDMETSATDLSIASGNVRNPEDKTINNK